jgi:lysozyme
MSRFSTSAKVLAAAVVLIGAFEGVRTVAYLDPVKVPTICFGHTRGVKIGDVATMEECNALLKNEILVHEAGVRRCLANPDGLPDGAYVAFNSLAYNIGVGAFCRSTLVKKANFGDIVGACNEITKWNRAGGIIWRGLTIRREQERNICLGGLPR